jgi:hypothetical protein
VFARSQVIRQSARKEFEEARNEQDPEVIARLLLVGRDCVLQIKEKVAFQCFHDCVGDTLTISILIPLYFSVHDEEA